jgi:ActR/RegA family two-component response regulator
MVKIILTGYPALQNAVTAINKGVDAYLIKPVNADELLRVVKEHLDKQKRSKQYGEKEVAQFIETRLREVQTEEQDKSKTAQEE